MQDHGAVPIEQIVQQVAWLLVATTAIGVVAHVLRLPYVIALVIGGVLFAASRLVAVPELDPSLVLFVFLPPLLFDAAFRIEVREAKAVSLPIVILAVPGVLLTAAIVGVLLAWILGLPLTIALLFGSIVAATDPVAVVAVFQRLGVHPQLATLLEGESLVNDGMAITVYTVLLTLAVAGHADPLESVTLFGREVLGGLAVGTILGFLGSLATRWVDEAYLEMMLSTTLAYGSFLIAQEFDASGPLACVAAGCVHGSYGRAIGMSERTRTLLDELWQYLGFVANGLVFLLVGFSVSVGSIVQRAWPVTVAVIAILVARLVVVLGPPLLVPHRLQVMNPRDRIVMIWGGLRGALTVALAFALPAETPARDLMIAMAFGVVLSTLVIQGLTLPVVIRWTGVERSH